MGTFVDDRVFKEPRLNLGFRGLGFRGLGFRKPVLKKGLGVVFLQGFPACVNILRVRMGFVHGTFRVGLLRETLGVLGWSISVYFACIR